jgi:hypothetical protein
MICIKPCAKTSKMCLKEYHASKHIPKMCLKHVPKYPRCTSTMCQNLQDMPQAYAKIIQDTSLKTYIKHTFQHVKNLVHEISDHQTFLNFNIKKNNTFFKTFLSLAGLDRATGGASRDDTRTTSGGLMGHPILDPWGSSQIGFSENPSPICSSEHSLLRTTPLLHFH